MSSLVVSLLIFVLTIGGVLLGLLLRTALPDHHLSKDAQDVVRLGAALIATMAALVLGLLIASAKSTFDTQSNQVRQITADIFVLDNLLRQYGPETLPLRTRMRAAIGPFVDRLWREKDAHGNAPFEANAESERVYLDIQALTPTNDTQHALQARAAQVATDLVQTRVMLYVGSGNSIPAPFLAILTFWIVVLFANFSLFSKLNATVFVVLSLFAFSAACALFLVLELSEPFTGLMTIPQAPLREALAPLS